MAASFTATQNSGDIRIITLEDTSTGLVGITGRLIYLRRYDGNYLVPEDVTTDYIFWPAADSEIEVDVLDKDYALDTSVIWYAGSTASATVTTLTLFTAYSELFLLQLTQALAANRTLITNKNYWENKIKLRTLIDDAAQAVSQDSDQTIATFCLDEAKKLTDNIATFFG